MAVISVGKNNHYGHPSPITLEHLKINNVTIFRTDQLGAIEIEYHVNGKGNRIITGKQETIIVK